MKTRNTRWEIRKKAKAAQRGLALLLLFSVFRISYSVSPLFASEDPYQHYLRGLLEEKYGKPEEALKEYEQVLLLDPKSWFIHESMAFLALRLGRMDRALEEAKKVAQLEPENPRSFIILGRVHLARGEAQPASQAFDKALQLDPENNEALLYAAHIRLLTSPKDALSYYEKFLQNNPHSLEARARLAELQQRLGDLQAAEQSWQKVVEMDPNDLSANLALAQIYEVRQDTAAALSTYETCRALDPQNLAILLRLGELYFRYGQSAKAHETFEQAARLAPKDITVNFWLALLAEERKDWDQAIHRMSEVSRHSREPGVLLRLAYYHSQKGQGRLAVQDLKRLHRQDPNNPDFLYYVALSYEDLRKPRQAIRWFNKTIAKDPNRADAYFHLATNWDRVGRFDRAEANLLQALKLNPYSAVALNYLGYSWADKGKNLPQALEYIQRAVELEPDNGAFLDSLGWVYYKLGRLAEAESAMAQAVKKIEDDPVVWEHYGDVLVKTGKTQQAVQAWQEALLFSPENRGLQKRLEETGGSAALPSSAPRVILKRVEGNFRKVQSLAGFMRMDGQSHGESFEAHGLFYYERPQLFRFEIMGPFFTPQALLVKNPAGLQWLPKELESLDDQAQWLHVFGDFLSGDLVNRFDNPKVQVGRSGDQLTYEAEEGELRIDQAKKVLTQLLWKEPSRPVLKIRFQDYREVAGLWLPGRVECETPSGRMNLVLDLEKLKINPSLNASLFRLPDSTKKK